MNIQSFYEYVILRDILAFMLPGGITLAGIYMIAYAYGVDRIEKYLPFLTQLNPFLSVILILLLSFLIGHIWDMLYRLIFQKRKAYQREDTYRKLLVGDAEDAPDCAKNHIASEIRGATGEFLRIDWKKTPINEWIDSGKAFEASVLLSYWIEEEDPKLFGTEIGRPIVQSHLLHSTGMAFLFLGAGCIPLVTFFRLAGKNIFQNPDFITLSILSISTIIFGVLLISQGIHKREIFLEHVFRVFYVIWRKRVLENRSGPARSYGTAKNKSR